MFKFCIATLLALSLSAVSGSFLKNALETVGYMALKKALIESGDTEIHADCFVKVLKATGTTEDFGGVIFDPDRTLQKIQDKWQFADFVCSPPGLIVAVLLFGFVFVTCCCCFIRCCMCRTKEPIIIQMANPVRTNGTNIPYVKMDVV